MNSLKRCYPRPGDMCFTHNVAWMAITVKVLDSGNFVAVTWMNLWGEEFFDPIVYQKTDIISWSEEFLDPNWTWQLVD